MKTVQQLQHKIRFDIKRNYHLRIDSICSIGEFEEVQVGESSMETIEALELEEPDTP